MPALGPQIRAPQIVSAEQSPDGTRTEIGFDYNRVVIGMQPTMQFAVVNGLMQANWARENQLPSETNLPRFSKITVQASQYIPDQNLYVFNVPTQFTSDYTTNLRNLEFTVNNYTTGVGGIQYVPETEEQRLGWLRNEAVRDLENAVANERAERLLVSHLSPTQVIELKRRGRFRVILPDGREFVIERGRAQNVWRVERGKKVMRYCAHPGEAVPDADTMLSQFLMLKHAPQLFEEIANKTPWDDVREARDPVARADAIIAEIVSGHQQAAQQAA